MYSMMGIEGMINPVLVFVARQQAHPKTGRVLPRPTLHSPFRGIAAMKDARSIQDALSVGSVGTGSGSNLGLPLVAVGEQLLLVVQQLLAGLGGVLGIRGY